MEILERIENKHDRSKFTCFNAILDKNHISTVLKEFRISKSVEYDLLNQPIEYLLMKDVNDF